MSYIPTSKFGDCTQCPAKGVSCVKVGKYLICTNCNNANKREKQLANAKERDSLRRLGHKQVQNGNYDHAAVQVLKNEIDRIFSRIVRLRAADEYGNCQCFTCTNVNHWTLMDCGHFISRSDTQIRFDFRNARVQCKGCNQHREGNISVYHTNLENEYPGLPEQLKEISMEVYKWSRDELKQLHTDLLAKLRIAERVFKDKANHDTNT